MRFFYFLTAMSFLVLQSTAWATTSEKLCRPYDVNDHNNPWEEGFGEFGHPQVDGDSQDVEITFENTAVTSVSIGQMDWDKDDAVFQTKTTAKKDKVILIRPKKYDATIKLNLYSSDRGSIYYQESKNEEAKFVGKFDCSSTEEAEKANIGDKNVVQLSKKDLKALPKVVRDRLYDYDMAFELGDGYYDIVKFEYYKVLNKKGLVIGYKMWAHLTYTEGDDVEASITYDRNALVLRDTLETY